MLIGIANSTEIVCMWSHVCAGSGTQNRNLYNERVLARGRPAARQTWPGPALQAQRPRSNTGPQPKYADTDSSPAQHPHPTLQSQGQSTIIQYSSVSTCMYGARLQSKPLYNPMAPRLPLMKWTRFQGLLSRQWPKFRVYRPVIKIKNW